MLGYGIVVNAIRFFTVSRGIETSSSLTLLHEQTETMSVLVAKGQTVEQSILSIVEDHARINASRAIKLIADHGVADIYLTITSSVQMPVVIDMSAIAAGVKEHFDSVLSHCDVCEMPSSSTDDSIPHVLRFSFSAMPSSAESVQLNIGEASEG